MKTKILVLTILIATSAIVLYASDKVERKSGHAGCVSQIKQVIERNLTMTKDMNETTANVFIKLDDGGNVADIMVFYPNKEMAQEIKWAIEKEHFDVDPENAGIYKINVKFRVR